MKRTEIRNGELKLFVALILLVFVSGCANQAFQVTSGATLSPQAMQHMVLRAKYPEPLASKIPVMAKQSYETAFLSISKPNVRVIAKDTDPNPEKPYYYLDTEVTKYKPGSPIGRLLLTPVFAFGLWGSYVNVDYSIYDPATKTSLGSGIIRKANLWGGILGKSITSETQLHDCPEEIMDELDSVMKK